MLFGARLAMSGGRETWVRTALIGAGVAFGVAFLLIAASLPNMVDSREQRTDSRDFRLLDSGKRIEPGTDTLLVASTGIDFRDGSFGGFRLKPEGSRAPVPPGIDRLPGPGEVFVSPALKRLLAAEGGELILPRLPERIVGEIGPAGLSGPNELWFYAYDGASTLKGGSVRIDHFGDHSGSAGVTDAELALLTVVAITVLLLPVMIFIVTAVRFGSDRRDRRLAALRLVGADVGMTHRIAAGETLFGAVLGLFGGGLLFLAGRNFAGQITLFDFSVFPGDISPEPRLALLIGILVPAAAIVASFIGIRGVSIEPMGVVRRATPPRRKLAWRLVMPALSLLLLLPMIGSLQGGGDVSPWQLSIGIVALLASVPTLLPWTAEAVVTRLDSLGGVSLQLASRRLQLDSGPSARSVGFIAVTVAGAIALQALLVGGSELNGSVTTAGNGMELEVSPNTMQVEAGTGKSRNAGRAIARTRGVRSVVSGSNIEARRNREGSSGYLGRLTVAACESIERLTDVGSCRDGDTFLVSYGGRPVWGGASRLPGETINLGRGRNQLAWTLPEDVRPANLTKFDYFDPGVLVTPAVAARSGMYRLAGREMHLASLDPTVPDAREHLRNTAHRLSSFAFATDDSSGDLSETEYGQLRNAILAGVAVVLALIGMGVLITTVEQLRERRRSLAALAAFGASRSALARSILWQAAIPVGLGIALAVIAGTSLATILLKVAGLPVVFDWTAIISFSAIGASIVFLVTLATLPLLGRLTRPEGLRTE